ncbi:hypothetical protein QN277_027377 [Acacia crassicarpa]|uniref:non-specific serine/threonine protein kinase n=1 Tax=Acacia crassicarpa TaxID=499986 RepID=A0AAE1JDD5_9FABA|nr:hypothetical protein QN277_027377 [Acacia crassicarpa]
MDNHRRSPSAESGELGKGNSREKKTSSKGRRARSVLYGSWKGLDLEPLCTKEEGTSQRPASGDMPEDFCRTLNFEASSSNASTSDTECPLDTANNTQWRIIRFMKKGSYMRFNHPPKNIPKLTRKTVKRIKEDLIPVLHSLDSTPSLDPDSTSSFNPKDRNNFPFKSSWKHYSFAQLQAATNNFSDDMLIGKGGYAEVYKGKMEDGTYVAIKKLTRGTQEEMTSDFLSELGIIVHVDHPNIAKLIGYGVEGGMFLVLQLSPHGSLAGILYGPRERLDWNIRFKVALGTAVGLQYLHEGCQKRIIHRDIKAANILLSEDFEPQVSDFGLAKWLPGQLSHHTVDKIEGTFGYLPPEFFMHGIVDEKTDVFAYGVLLLELITGRQALDSSQKSLVMWAKPLLSVDKIKELVDPYLSDAYDEEQIKIVMMTASLCIEQSSCERPYMSEVVKTLKGEEGGLEFIMERQKSKLRRTYSEELLDAEDYNSTKYLSVNDSS